MSLTIHIYIMCFNDAVLLPHTIRHYRDRFPSSTITVCDNESTDGSVALAKSLGCQIVKFSTNNKMEERVMLSMRNNIWKTSYARCPHTWTIIVDMEEWLEMDEEALLQEDDQGANIINTKGYQMIGEADAPVTLEGLDLHLLWKGVYDVEINQIVCFRSDKVQDMNYTGRGPCHLSNPLPIDCNTTIKKSMIQYPLKHMNYLSKAWILKKNTQRLLNVHNPLSDEEVMKEWEDWTSRPFRIIPSSIIITPSLPSLPVTDRPLTLLNTTTKDTHCFSKKTICLTMIVKNEAHLIVECFENLTKYISFDYWVINDNGSTDGTPDLIQKYFAEKGIPGELDLTPWKDFAYNRTRAFEVAFQKTDYAFVWDADDEIHGDFRLPSDLTADCYKFIYGNEGGTRYSRAQLFNNHKHWKYVGVLHEYPQCTDEAKTETDILGEYFFVSGRRGARNLDPEKYLKDALVLEKAFHIALENKDPLCNRYCYYTAQSYLSYTSSFSGDPTPYLEKSLEYYKKVLTLENSWYQEKYMSCLEIYDILQRLCEIYKVNEKEDTQNEDKNNIQNFQRESLDVLLQSYSYDARRVEGVYRLIRHYCIHGPVEVAYAYYTLIQKVYEEGYLGSKSSATHYVSSFLFTKKQEYDFFLPYYMIIVAGRLNRHDTVVQMYRIIFQQQYLCSGQWWIHNSFNNIQFSIPHFCHDLSFLEAMLVYIEALQVRNIPLSFENYRVVDTIIQKYRPLLSAPVIPPSSLSSMNLSKKKENVSKNTILFSITTCKRFDLFQQTMNSILRNWLDIDQITEFFCVDDNSSEEDRVRMKTDYPFFEYYMKATHEKGHRESLNIIWDKLVETKPTYWIHMEDDWVYFKQEKYVSRAISILDKYNGENIHQVVFNREYGLMMEDMVRVNVRPLEKGVVLHEMKENVVGRNCAYWPHYSLQPSMCRAEKIIKLGNYNSPNFFFERDYANKYHHAGYETAFFDGIYSLHIGKQHWEKEGQNAYQLNQIGQFQIQHPPSSQTE